MVQPPSLTWTTLQPDARFVTAASSSALQCSIFMGDQPATCSRFTDFGPCIGQDSPEKLHQWDICLYIHPSTHPSTYHPSIYLPTSL